MSELEVLAQALRLARKAYEDASLIAAAADAESKMAHAEQNRAAEALNEARERYIKAVDPGPAYYT